MKVALANMIAFCTVFAIAEVAVRAWREGGLWAGLRSLGNCSPISRNSGPDDWLVADPECGYALAPGRNGVNSLGLRHEELISPKPASCFRLLVLGDSIAWPPDGFVSLLRARLRDIAPTVEVINASVPGYTSYQERNLLEKTVDKIAPDLVLVQYCCNDNHKFLHQLAGKSGWLLTEEARRALVPQGDGVLDSVCRWSYLALEVRRAVFGFQQRGGGEFPWTNDPGFAAAWRDDSWSMIADEYCKICELSRARRCAVAVVAVPYEPQLADEARKRDLDYVCKPQQHLRAICGRLGVPFLDPFDEFVSARGEGLYIDGVHLSSRGHSILARQIEQFLVAMHLVPQR